MATNKTTLRFWLRKDRPNKDGSAPVHLVYQIKGDKRVYAIPDVKVFPINWDLKEQLAVYRNRKEAKKIDPAFDLNFLPSSDDIDDVNKELQKAKNYIGDIETRFKLDKITFSPEMVIDSLKTIREPETKKNDVKEPTTSIVDFINQFVADSSATHKEGTLKVYTGLATHLSEFEKSTGNQVTFDNTDVATLRRFQAFLAEPKFKTSQKGKVFERSMNNVTAAKQISTLKTLLNYARTIYKFKVNPDYRDYKVTRKDSDFEVITLTQDEFLALYNLDLVANNRLDPVRDIFCFSCATGLRYSDLLQLRQEHIRKDNTIRMTAAKTGQKLVIPLNSFSYSILQKYDMLDRPLPLISNQKLNDYIKEIGELAGIDTPIEKVRMQGVKKKLNTFKKYQLLSIHVGRKSFITLSLEKGIAIQEVMSLSGHTTFKAFRRYVDVNDTRKKTVMADAWGAVPKSNLKAV